MTIFAHILFARVLLLLQGSATYDFSRKWEGFSADCKNCLDSRGKENPKMAHSIGRERQTDTPGFIETHCRRGLDV